MIADPENDEGLLKLSEALDAGFSDAAAVRELLRNEKISTAARNEAASIFADLLN